MRRLIAVLLCVCFVFVAAMYGPAQATVTVPEVVPEEIGVPDVLSDVHIEIEVPLPVVEPADPIEWEPLVDGDWEFHCGVWEEDELGDA